MIYNRSLLVIRLAVGEEFVHIAVLEKLLFALGKQLFGKLTTIPLSLYLLQQVDEIDEVVQRFDPADHFPVDILLLVDHLSQKPKVGYWQRQGLSDLRILLIEILTERPQERFHRETEFSL